METKVPMPEEQTDPVCETAKEQEAQQEMEQEAPSNETVSAVAAAPKQPLLYVLIAVAVLLAVGVVVVLCMMPAVAEAAEGRVALVCGETTYDLQGGTVLSVRTMNGEEQTFAALSPTQAEPGISLPYQQAMWLELDGEIYQNPTVTVYNGAYRVVGGPAETLEIPSAVGEYLVSLELIWGREESQLEMQYYFTVVVSE